MIWQRSAKDVLRSGDFGIVRFRWQAGASYVLWRLDMVMGRFGSAEDAIAYAEALQIAPESTNRPHDVPDIEKRSPMQP